MMSYLKKFQYMVEAGESIPDTHNDLFDNHRRDDGRPKSWDGKPVSKDGRLRSRTTMIAKEDIQVMKHVGKLVEKNVLDMKNQVDSLSQPPPHKEGFMTEKIKIYSALDGL